MTNNKLTITIASILLCTASCNSQGQQSTLDTYMNGLIKEQRITGAAIAAYKNGNWILSKSYGYADAASKTEITEATGFSIMSLTKTFIACAIMQLAIKEKIDLHAPITQYLDSLPPAYSNVQLIQLLTHTAGVPDYVEVDGYMHQANKAQTPMEILQPILSKPLLFAPGEKAAYSNSGYFLLGMLIEKASGTTLKEYLTTHIFKPLEMNSTYLDDISSINASRAKGYASMNGKIQEVPPLNPTQYWAAGGIVSTMGDMIKWNDALRTGKILPHAVVSQMMQPAKLNDGSICEYGIGFELLNTPGMKVAGYTGAGIGFNCASLQFLNDQATVVVLTNTSNGNSAMIAKNVHDLLAGSETNKVQADADRAVKDKLDSLVTEVFTEALKGNASRDRFENEEVFTKFEKEEVSFIRDQGSLKQVVNKGEKTNPESIVRRYQISFEKGSTTWIIIFSKDGKIMVTNHM